MKTFEQLKSEYLAGEIDLDAIKKEFDEWVQGSLLPDAKKRAEKRLVKWQELREKKITLNITMDIPREVLLTVFITALEGGSNYWYFLSEETCNLVRKSVPKSDELYLAVAVFRAVFDEGIEVPVNDCENESEVLGTLSMKTLPERLQMLANDKNYAHYLREELAENGDATSADVIFQFLVLGEVVYG